MTYEVGDKVRYTGGDSFYVQPELMGKIGVVTFSHPSFVKVDFPGTSLGSEGVYLTNVKLVEDE